MKALGYFTIKDILHDRWRSVLTISSLAVIMVGYLILSAASNTIKTMGQQTAPSSNLVVVAADVIDPMESTLNDSLLTTVLEVDPGYIDRTFPVIFRHLRVENRISQVRAVPVAEMPLSIGLTLVEGSWPAIDHEIVVGESLSRISKWKTGSSVNIYGSNFTVSGIVRSTEKNSGSIWMDYQAGRELFVQRKGYQAAYLVLTPGADPEEVRAFLQSDPNIDGQYTVYLESALSSNYQQLSRNIILLGSIMAVLALGAITFGIYNATSLSLAERSRQVILLRVLGFSRQKIQLVLTARALGLTLSAYAVSLAAALAFFTYQNANTVMGISDLQVNLGLSAVSVLAGLGLSILFTMAGVSLTTRNLLRANLVKGSRAE
jgi:ABC-type antimicrobial peptide transport system permease subunit